MKQALAQVTTDTNRILLMADVSASYRYSRPDSAMWYARQGETLARRIRYAKGEGRCLTQLGFILAEKGDLASSLSQLLHAQDLGELAHDQMGLARSLQSIGYLYVSLVEYNKAKAYLIQAKTLYNQTRTLNSDAILVLASLGYAYRYQNQLDSARYYQRVAYQLATRLAALGQSAWGDPLPFVLLEMGAIDSKAGHRERAIQYLHRAKTAAIADNNRQVYTRTCNLLSTIFRQQNQPDSAIYYAHQALTVARQMNLSVGVLINSQLLAQLYKAGQQTDSALKYTELRLVANDSLYNQERIRQLESVNFAEQIRRRRIEAGQARFESQVRQVALLSGLAVLLIIALILWRTNRRQRQANALLSALNKQVGQQKKEITHQRDDLSKTLADLRTTQTQLIQAEKMASLGALTAGIAHEIQNPLNFVNNFSEVSAELVGELREEETRPQPDTKLIGELLDDLTQNLHKIIHHGGRASAIVKGMLEHSRTGTGEKQPTNLNALTDEYLKIAYHGWRAKDKADSAGRFNCELKTDFGPDLGPVEVFPQELGRVLLNLFNNAFYAVQQKQNLGLADYQPRISIHTRQLTGHVQIRVSDNGTGIANSVKAKIFQPFFTTKPTGEGTGLGLSLSYDIVTKGHQGSLLVQSQEGEGTEFIIQLPTASVNSSA
ncbi:tetratricopeptide repeat-containing sensor histidine kinase [Spirosoma areae]